MLASRDAAYLEMMGVTETEKRTPSETSSTASEKKVRERDN